MLTDVGGNTPIIQTGGNGMDSFGGNWIWAFLIFALLGNNGGFGNNNNQVNPIYQSQQFTQLDGGIRAIQNGLCDTTYTLTNGLKDGFYNNAMNMQHINTNLGNAICNQTYELSNRMNAISSQIASCCCDTQRSVDSVNLNMERQTNAIIQSQNHGTQRILDWLSNKELSDKNQQIFEMSQKAQTLEIIAAQKPIAPIPAYIQPNPYATYYATNPTC